jgi:hypothetical protein
VAAGAAIDYGRSKREEARRGLAETYSWFIEGHDTADLKQARTFREQPWHAGNSPSKVSYHRFKKTFSSCGSRSRLGQRKEASSGNNACTLVGVRDRNSLQSAIHLGPAYSRVTLLNCSSIPGSNYGVSSATKGRGNVLLSGV